MYIDVIHFIKNCETCNAMRPNYNQNPSLTTTFKGKRPFQFVSIDLITNLEKSSEGYQH